MIFAQMLDDPSSRPDLFPTGTAQEKERQRLFRLIEELVQWENTTNETVLAQAREEIRKIWRADCAADELVDDARHRMHYVPQPFRREPEFGVTSVNYDFVELLAQAAEPF